MPEGVQPSPAEKGNTPPKNASQDWDNYAEHFAKASGAPQEQPGAGQNLETQRPEVAPQQIREQTIEEKLNSTMQELNKNIKDLNINFAGLGNSNVEPELGSQQTQEKWVRLKKFLKSDTGENIIFLSGVGLTATGIGVSVGVPLTIALAGAGLGAGYIKLNHEIFKAAEKGWDKFKKWRNNKEEQETKPK